MLARPFGRPKKRKIRRKPKVKRDHPDFLGVVRLGSTHFAHVYKSPARKRTVLVSVTEPVYNEYEEHVDDEYSTKVVRVNFPDMVFAVVRSAGGGFTRLYTARRQDRESISPENFMTADLIMVDLPNTGDETSVGDVCLGSSEHKVRRGLDPLDAFWNSAFTSSVEELKRSVAETGGDRYSMLSWLNEIASET